MFDRLKKKRLQQKLEKALRDQRENPASFDVDGLGTFTLNHSLHSFEAELSWLGQPVQLSFPADSDRDRCLDAVRALFARQSDWDRRLREFAAGELLPQANQWAGIGGEEEDEAAVPVTRAQFMEQIAPELIEMKSDGGFDFWFHDGELFFGHAIRVSGYLEEGPDTVRLEG